MKLTVRYAGLTDPGRLRQTNEDNWIADTELGAFIVADGMGGEFAGALASKAVVTTLPGMLRTHFKTMVGLPKSSARRHLTNTLATLSNQMRDQTQNEPGLAGMGATVVCAVVRGNEMLLAHMGDSRAYLLRSGKLKQLTKDHTLVQLLIDSGDITPEEAVTHPAWGCLSRSVGMVGMPLPQTRLLRLNPGDLLLLCTDGLYVMLRDHQIESILNEPASLQTKCNGLIDAANEAGGKDNITVLLLAFAQVVRNKKNKKVVLFLKASAV